MALKLKSEYAGVIIGFKNKSVPLSQRTEADLNFLYQRAKDRDIPEWLIMFETESVPTQKEVDAVKEKVFNEKQSVQKSRTRNES